MSRNDEFGKGKGFWSPEYGSTMPKLFHGSNYEFNPGDTVSTRMQVNNHLRGENQHRYVPWLDDQALNDMDDAGYGQKKHEGEPMVFASDDPEFCKTFGKHIYEVEPVNHSDVVHLIPGEFGSHSGYKVIRKL